MIRFTKEEINYLIEAIHKKSIKDSEFNSQDQLYGNEWFTLVDKNGYNKKIKIEIGLTNPFKSYKKKYGDLIWFPCGIFVISSANMSNSTSGCSISISGKDKMVLLDGSVGGMLPSSVAFHQIDVEDEEGKITYEYPTIRQIIKEAVFHFGSEDESNIFINDIEETGK